MSRRFERLMGWAALIALIAMLGLAGAGAVAAPSGELNSGAVGLTRIRLEAAFGTPMRTTAMPGAKPGEQVVAYGTQAGTISVVYRDLNGEPVATAVELVWAGGGVSESVAGKTIASLLPSDARLTERYVAPATPDGPAALTVFRYASAALADASNGVLAPEILAIQHGVWSEASGAMKIARVSLTLRDRTQATG